MQTSLGVIIVYFLLKMDTMILSHFPKKILLKPT